MRAEIVKGLQPCQEHHAKCWQESGEEKSPENMTSDFKYWKVCHLESRVDLMYLCFWGQARTSGPKLQVDGFGNSINSVHIREARFSYLEVYKKHLTCPLAGLF